MLGVTLQRAQQIAAEEGFPRGQRGRRAQSSLAP